MKSGLWSPVKNLGPEINSPFDEDAPFIDKEGKTLWFSSKGHNSGGGYDIFKSAFIYDDSLNLNGNWSKPVNLGYPINTGADDIYFMLSPNGERAYYSSNKLEGFGEMDIYRITFNENKKNNIDKP